MTLFAVSEVLDSSQIREFLLQDANYCAYALGDLEPPYSENARWFSASRTGGIEGLALLYSSLSPPVMFFEGKPEAISSLMMYGIGPDEIFFTIRRDFEPTLRQYYDLTFINDMLRMRVVKGTFNPVGSSQPDFTVSTLSSGDSQQALRLVEVCSTHDDRDSRDIAFSSDMLTSGFYRGVWHNGDLIAMAGTHIAARREGVAAIGNVMVHPQHRRLGLGIMTSQTVVAALLEAGFQLIVLNVRQDNLAAVKLYKRLGFKVVCEFAEGIASRR